MPKLIVCLGNRLNPHNSLSPVLINRLLDAVNLCRKNVNPVLLLMGSFPYGDLRKDKISEASAMKRYLEENFKEELKETKIITEETTQSTVEQLCYLKKFIQKEGFNFSDLIIISSEFFSDRVKLYTEYIFGTIDGIIFINSIVPMDMLGKFREAEEFKIKEGQDWLKGQRKGDDETILIEQKKFQDGVIKGEIPQPPIS